jgi:protocatechuate 3,4-dioxygenase beta subunit
VAFPDDAVFDPTNTCELGSARELTEGPCYFAADAGPDISLGLDGLPTQLCLQFVDARCNPLVNRVVEVWHADRHGRYSGNTDNSGDAGRFDTGFCTEDHPDALATNAFRGQLTTNSSGRVDFVTCFPGWYPGRTIHFHYSVADNDSDRRFVSQLCFADTFADEICTDHELYRQRGTQDTPFSSDAVFSRDAVENYALSTRRNSDGTLLAYARIQIDA